MTARQKLEGLTSSWYGFAALSALFAVLRNGIGPFTLMWTALVFFLSVFSIFVLGRRLLAKGHLTRFLLLIGSALFAIFGGLSAGRDVLAFFSQWSYSLLIDSAAGVVWAYMNCRSFRVLTDESVKAHFNS